MPVGMGTQERDDALARPADLAQLADDPVEFLRSIGAGRRAVQDQVDDVPRQPR